MRKYIELTEYNEKIPRVIIFTDSIQGMLREYDRDRDKEFTEVITSGCTFLVNETIDEILNKIEDVESKE